MKRSIIILLITAPLWTLGIDKCPRSTNECSYQAWIVVEPQASCLKITAYCFNHTPQDQLLSYELKVEKEGKSGKTRTTQKGLILMPKGKEKSLSQTALNVSPDDCYRIRLKVYKDKKLVDEDSLSYP